MKKTNDKSWIINIVCPFCGEVIVTAYDHSLIPQDMPAEERERITCSDETMDNLDGRCEHLAFLSDWAYAGHSIETHWNKEMIALASALEKGETEITDTETSDQELADFLGNALDEYSPSEVEELLRKVLPSHEHKFFQQYIEKFDGVGDGGPTYTLIFLRKGEQTGPTRKTNARPVRGRRDRKRMETIIVTN